MEFASFGFSAVVSVLGFTAFRALVELGAPRLRVVLLSCVAALALAAMAWVTYSLDRAASLAWGRSRMGGAPGSELAELVPSLGAHALILGFMEVGTAFYMVLGAAQGVVLAMAFAAVSKQSSWQGADKWKASLGRVALAVPLPAAIVAFSVFYQDNRERFASVDLGGFVRLALNPVASSSSQRTSSDGKAESGRFFETERHVAYAKESLDGSLRTKDLDYVRVLNPGGSRHRGPDALRDFNMTSAMESGLCRSIHTLHRYIDVFKDYNLLTIDIARPLINLQTGWLTHVRELNMWADELAGAMKSPDGLVEVHRILAEDIGAADFRSGAAEGRRSPSVSAVLTRAPDYEGFAVASTSEFVALQRVAEERLDRATAPPDPNRADPAKCPPAAANGGGVAPPPRDAGHLRVGGPEPAHRDQPGAAPREPDTQTGEPNRAPRGDEGGGAGTGALTNPRAVAGRTVQNRIMDLHSPYLLLGIANFYAAIGSFESAFLMSQRWLDMDRKLRAASPALDGLLPRWFTLRVRTEAARFYKQVPSEIRSVDFQKRLVSDVVREGRDLVEGAGFSLAAFEADEPTAAKRDRCPGLGSVEGLLRRRGVEPVEDAVRSVLNLLLTVATQELERLDIVGTSGAVSQSDYDAARALARVDFGCFARAFPRTLTHEERARALASLSVYQWNAVSAWGRVAIRWADSGRALRRLGDEQRKEIMLAVRARLGLAVDMLEALAGERAGGEPGRAPGAEPQQGRPDPEIADDARRARRVLEEALALAL